MKTKVTFKDSFDNGQMSVEITGNGNIRLGMGGIMGAQYAKEWC